MINQLENYGERTYKVAWFLEKTAAIVGLSIGALLLYQSLEPGVRPTVTDMISFIGVSMLIYCSIRIRIFCVNRIAWNGVNHILISFPSF